MKSTSAMSALLLLLLFASTIESRNEPGTYWKSVAKDQPMTREADHGLTPWSSAPKHSNNEDDPVINYFDHLFKSSPSVRNVPNDNTKTPESSPLVKDSGATPEMITIVIHVKIPTSFLTSPPYYYANAVPKGNNPSPFNGGGGVPTARNDPTPYHAHSVPQVNNPSPYDGDAVPQGNYNPSSSSPFNGDAVPKGKNNPSPYIVDIAVPKGEKESHPTPFYGNDGFEEEMIEKNSSPFNGYAVPKGKNPSPYNIGYGVLKGKIPSPYNGYGVPKGSNPSAEPSPKDSPVPKGKNPSVLQPSPKISLHAE